MSIGERSELTRIDVYQDSAELRRYEKLFMAPMSLIRSSYIGSVLVSEFAVQSTADSLHKLHPDAVLVY